MPDTPATTPQIQLDRFRLAVTLLGGPRAAAQEIGVGDRTVERLIAGASPIHDGFLRDIARALLRHADACKALERQLSPAFAGNLVDGQPRETGRRTRHQQEAR